MSMAWRFLARLHRDQTGQVAVLAGLLMLVLLGGTGLVLDTGLLLYEFRNEQNAADAAALAGAGALWQGALTSYASPYNCVGGSTGNAAVNAACNTAVANGYSASEVTVSLPPVSAAGVFNGVSGYIEVNVARTLETLLIRLVGPTQVTPRAIAVGGTRRAPLTYAIYALRGGCPRGMDLSGSGRLTVEGGIVVNASCQPPPSGDVAFDVTAGDVVASGPIHVTGKARYNSSVSPPPIEGTPPVPDPFAKLEEVITGTTPYADIWPLGVPDGVFEGQLSSQCTDARCTAYYANDGRVPPQPVNAGVQIVGGAKWLLTAPDIRGGPNQSTPSNPSTFNVCDARLENVPDPEGVTAPTHVLYPGIYWGGIYKTGNCGNPSRVMFKSGVYVFAGQGNKGPFNISSIDRVWTDMSNGGVLFYFTNIPLSLGCNPSGPNPCDYGSVNVGNGKMDFETNTAPAYDPTTCELGPSYTGVLLMVNRGAPECLTVDGSCQNEVFVQSSTNSRHFRGALYDRYGRLRATGPYDFDDAMLVFNTVNMSRSGATTVSVLPCAGGGPMKPFLVQ